MTRTGGLCSLVAALTVVLAGGTSGAGGKYGPGASDVEIKIGNTCPYSGPASAYGTIGRAIAAYMQMVNDKGGINGRKIRFLTLDDGYSPSKTVEQVRRLVEKEKVLLIFNNLGTPTNAAVHAYMNVKRVPHLFLASGASMWGQPGKYPWTMAWQPSYAAEGAVYAKYILENIVGAKIGVLYQNDDYGKDYLTGFKEALGKGGRKKIVAELSYEVTDPTVDSQIVTLKNRGADVFFNVTTPKFAAQAIRRAHDIRWHPTHFLNAVSTSVGAVLNPAGLQKAKGIITSLYAKDPTDPQWQDSKEYEEWSAWMDKYYPQGSKADSLNVYGYNAAMTLVHVLAACGDDLTRENVMRQAASIEDLQLPMLLPGIRINTGPDDYYPLEQGQLARFDGARWVLFGGVISAR